MPIVYALVSSDDRETPRYVGKTKLTLVQRVKSHVWSAVKHPKNTYKENWIRSVIDQGHSVEGIVLAEVDSEDDVYALEHYYIVRLKELGFPLTNGSDKGRGFEGYHHSQDWIDAARARRWLHSDESKALMSSLKKGKPLTLEHRKNIGEARKALGGHSSEHKANLGAANKARAGWKHTDEVKRICSETNLGRTHSAASKKRQRDTVAERGSYVRTPEFIEAQRQKQIDLVKQRKQDELNTYGLLTVSLPAARRLANQLYGHYITFKAFEARCLLAARSAA